MSKELDKEIERVLREGALSWNISYSDMCFIAEHFYELGCRRTAEKADEIEYNRQRAEESEKPIDGLDEEIERYLHSLGVGYGGWVDGMDDDDLRGIARHFANWGAEHLKK